GRHRLQCFRDHFLDLRVRYGPRRARPRFIEQAFQPVHPKSFAPLADGCSRNAKPLRYLAVAQSIAAAEHDAGTHRESLPGLRAARQHCQFLPLLWSDIEQFGGASDGHTQVWTESALYSTYF